MAAGLAVWSCGYAVVAGGDLWWHLAAGRLLWRRGPVGLTDPWSFTRQGRPWLHHEWLADVVLHGWERAFGREALVYWKWGLLVASFLLLLWLLRRLTRAPVSTYLAVLFAAILTSPFADIRPHLYSLLGYVVVLAATLGRPRPPSWLPLLFLLWANLHGGFLFGLMALAVVLAAGHTSYRENRARPALLWLACAAASLVNPSGIGAFSYPLRYALGGDSLFRTGILEWLPPFAAGFVQPPLVVPAIAAAGAAAAVLLLAPAWRPNSRIFWAGMGLTVLTLGMSLASRRFIPLFAESESLLVAPALAGIGEALAGRLGRVWRRAEPLLAASALVFGLVRLSPYPLTSAAFLPLTEADTFPVEVCDFIERNALAGNVLADYAWGGYLDLRTEGRMKVFIDSRADTVFDEETYRRYRLVSGQAPGWLEVAEGPDVQFVLWRRSSKVVPELLRSGRWRVLHEDMVSVLLARTGPGAPALPDPLQPTADSAYRELARGGLELLAGRPQEAAPHLRRALELAPNLWLACRNLVVAELATGQPVVAADTAARCQSIFPDPKLLSLAAGGAPLAAEEP